MLLLGSMPFLILNTAHAVPTACPAASSPWVAAAAACSPYLQQQFPSIYKPVHLVVMHISLVLALKFILFESSPGHKNHRYQFTKAIRWSFILSKKIQVGATYILSNGHLTCISCTQAWSRRSYFLGTKLRQRWLKDNGYMQGNMQEWIMVQNKIWGWNQSISTCDPGKLKSRFMAIGTCEILAQLSRPMM